MRMILIAKEKNELYLFDSKDQNETMVISQQTTSET